MTKPYFEITQCVVTDVQLLNKGWAATRTARNRAPAGHDNFQRLFLRTTADGQQLHVDVSTRLPVGAGNRIQLVYDHCKNLVLVYNSDKAFGVSPRAVAPVTPGFLATTWGVPWVIGGSLAGMAAVNYLFLHTAGLDSLGWLDWAALSAGSFLAAATLSGLLRLGWAPFARERHCRQFARAYRSGVAALGQDLGAQLKLNIKNAQTAWLSMA